MEGLIETSKQTDTLKGAARRIGLDGLVIVAVGSECHDGSVKRLEAKLVYHDADDVDGNVATFLGRKSPKALEESNSVSHSAVSSRRVLWQGGKEGEDRSERATTSAA